MIYKKEYKAPFGDITIITDSDSVIGIDFETHNNLTCSYFPVIMEKTEKWLDIYFSGKDPGKIPSVNLNVSDFQKEVYEILLSVPFGKTVSYGYIAEKLAEKRKINRMSAQAVGNALGKNPIPIIIPCHRVISSSGNIGGFSADINIKKFLLNNEGMAL